MDNLCSNSQPITASFAFELFMDIVEALPRMKKDWNDKKEQEFISSVLTEIHFPAVFLCIELYWIQQGTRSCDIFCNLVEKFESYHEFILIIMIVV
jgi:hypothetical protein